MLGIFSARQTRRVDRVGQAAEADALRAELGDQINKMGEGPPETVELPHYQRVTGRKGSERAVKAASCGHAAADSLFGEYLIATGSRQRILLKGKSLVSSRDACVADLHIQLWDKISGRATS